MSNSLGAEPPESVHGLGLVASGPRFEIRTPVSTSEYDAILSAVAVIGHVLEPPTHAVLLERNFAQLEDTEQLVRILLGLGPEYANASRRALTTTLISVTVNWLTSMRLYLDHEQTATSRRSEQSSDDVTGLRVLRSRTYDEVLGYRFCYKLRNYVQHCGLPINSLELTEPEPGSPLKRHVAVYLERDELLRTFPDGWGTVADDLRSLPERFEFMPLAKQCMSALRALIRNDRDRHLDAALEASAVVADAIARSDATADEHPALIRFGLDGGEVHSITPTALRSDVVEVLMDVRAGRRPREEVWARAAEQAELSVDQESVSSTFGENSPGYLALCSFLAQGGPTDAFLESLNQIAIDGGGYDVLLASLINVSVVLAHIAAGSLNTSAKALFGGLAGPYATARLTE